MATNGNIEIKPACQQARNVLEGASRVKLDDMTSEMKAAASHVSTCADCKRVVEV